MLGVVAVHRTTGKITNVAQLTNLRSAACTRSSAVRPTRQRTTSAGLAGAAAKLSPACGLKLVHPPYMTASEKEPIKA